MKLLLSTLGTATILLATPVAAQDAPAGGLFWAPWQPQVDAPVPQSRPAAAVKARLVAEVPQPEAEPHPILRIDRFWVIGSFR